MLSPRIPLSTVTVGTALARVARVVRFISVIADLDILTPVTCAEPAVEDQLSRRPVLISTRTASSTCQPARFRWSPMLLAAVLSIDERSYAPGRLLACRRCRARAN